MSWRLSAAAALLVAGLAAGSSARAGDLFQLALPAKDAPAQTLTLQDDADLTAARWRGGYYGGYRGGYYGGYRGGYYGYRGGYYGGYRGGYYPYRAYYPRYNYSFSFGYNYPYYAAPAYYYAPPAYYSPYCYSPISTAPGVTTYSLPEANVTYSVTRPNGNGSGSEQIPVPPVPTPRGDGTFPYDGGPSSPVPMPRAEPDPTSAPRRFHIAPLDELKVSLPNETKPAATPAKGKYVYPAYGEQPRRSGS